jgi:hypothetical protein
VIDVPIVVRNKALAAGAAAWLDELPALIAELAEEWELEVGPPFADATEGFVAPASVSDGERAVHKLIVPRDGDAARTRSPSCASRTARAAPGCSGTTCLATHCCWSGSVAR